MEVNDVKSAVRSSPPVNEQPTTVASQPDRVAEDAGAVAIDVQNHPDAASAARANLNNLISTTNVASNAVEEISKLVHSIGGIVEQAASGKVDPAKIPLLEREANQLVDAIKFTAQVQAPDGSKPLGGDPITSRWEAQALEIILPDLSNHELGFGLITLSKSDFVLNTRAAVNRSQEQLRTLQESLKGVSERAQSMMAELDVASQNAEASNASLRDVESALHFAGATRISIAEHPQEALGSVGRLGAFALSLLKGS